LDTSIYTRLQFLCAVSHAVGSDKMVGDSQSDVGDDDDDTEDEDDRTQPQTAGNTSDDSVVTGVASSLRLCATTACQLPQSLTRARCVSWHLVIHVSRSCPAVMGASASLAPTQSTTKAVAVLYAERPSQWCCACTNCTCL